MSKKAYEVLMDLPAFVLEDRSCEGCQYVDNVQREDEHGTYLHKGYMKNGLRQGPGTSLRKGFLYEGYFDKGRFVRGRAIGTMRNKVFVLRRDHGRNEILETTHHPN